MMNSGSGETICAFLNPCRRGGMECGLALRNGDKGGSEAKKKGGGRKEERKKSWEKNKFTSFIHRPLAWYRCLTMVTKEIKNMGISMWKAPGLWLCVQKAKELWFRGIFNLHSVSNKGLAVALRAVVQPDWGSGGKEGGQRRGQTGSQTSFVPPLYFSLSLFPLKSSISSLRPPPPPPPPALKVVNVWPEE